MTPNPRKLRPPIKRHGGKFPCCHKIIGCFPDHKTYVEPFIGGGSVLLNKPKAEREIVGDLEDDLINLWVVLQQRQEELFDAIRHVPYTQACWVGWTLDPTVADDPLDQAIAFLVRNRFSRGGLGKTFAWSDRLRGGKPGDANAWDTIRAELPAIAERVKDVTFHCRPALELIREFDDPDTLFYLDPPYLPETRTARKAYDHEMDSEDHQILANRLAECRGTFFLSGYRSELYDVIATWHDWHRMEWETANNSGQGAKKQRRTEVLWSNRPFPGSVRCAAAEPATIEG